MWLARIPAVFWLDARAEEVTMEQLVPQIAALSQFASELDGRLASAGIGGLEGAVELYQRLKRVIDGVSADELAQMVARVAALQRTLGEIERRIAAFRELKTALDRVDQRDAEKP